MNDDRSIPEKILSKSERTRKQHFYRLAKFCRDIARDSRLPEEMRVKAKALYSEWDKLQSYASPKERRKQAEQSEALHKRMEKFQKEIGPAML